MFSSPRNRTIALALLMYLLLAGCSAYFLTLKRDALQFHNRDYNYYIEQAIRLADPRLANHYAMNIEGFNFIGLQGIEGTNNLFQALHAEYFRYTYMALYAIFYNMLPLYIYYCLIFFLPILYFALLPHPDWKEAWKQVLLFLFLYALYPATFPSVTAELRPRILFTAAWCLVILAIYYERPFLEKLLFFGLLLGIREEGIVLGAVVVGLNFLRMYRKPDRWKQTLIFGALDVLALTLFLAFMNYGHYTRVDILFDPRNILTRTFLPYKWFLAAAGILLAALLVLIWRKKRERLVDVLTLLAYLVVIPITVTPLIRDVVAQYKIAAEVGPVPAWQVYLSMVSSSGSSLVAYILLLLVVLFWDSLRGKARRALEIGLVVVCAVFAVTNLAIIPAQVAGWRQQIPLARVVWEFKQAHDPYSAHVLLDYDTLQAFVDYDNVLVYNRLPAWLIPQEKRFYPDNKDKLVSVVRNSMEYAVITQASLNDVLAVTREAGLTASVIDSNEKYVVLKLR